MEGKSLVPILKGSKRKGHEYLGFEHFNEKALIAKDGWKIIQPGNKAQWELYNLNEDRTEMHNVADKYPDRLAKMQNNMKNGRNAVWLFLLLNNKTLVK